MMKKSSLGTGLSSLIPERAKRVDESEGASVNKENEVLNISVDSIVPNPNQPRYYFDGENLKDLSESIKEHGVVQPIIVTKLAEGKYELIAGERRLRASKLIGKKEIPAIVRKADNREKLELAIIENVQRHNLNAIEEAKAYRRLKDEFNLTQEEVAKKIGKGRVTVANTMRLLELPVDIQRGVIENKITEGHARAILGLDNPEKQRALYELILKGKLTVRDTENKVREIISPIVARKMSVSAINPEIQDLENRLEQNLGTKIQIKKKGATGKIMIDFFSEEEFDKIKGLLLGE
ncbi:MAG: ParB/RepB/Spo0J family partition protein [Candidatus Pacebacteria bacterium]|nr:ParB/RepB/Spo0J family partition protein [Candidatus Paceibacterota bacterium]